MTYSTEDLYPAQHRSTATALRTRPDTAPPAALEPAPLPSIATLPAGCRWGFCHAETTNPWACRHVVFNGLAVCCNLPAGPGGTLGPRCPACTAWVRERLAAQ